MIRKILCAKAILLALLAGYFVIYPAVLGAFAIMDPAIRGPGIPQAAWRQFRNLSPRYAAWARRWIGEGNAGKLSLENISGTEWPLFGSVFYLWGVENLQTAWDAGDHTAKTEPKVFARDAIIAASELVVDPEHAAWVKKHWGDNYLHRENVFYRMLVISALTSREKLLHDGAHTAMLRDQVETFVRELDESRTGLLDDYPGQCYPGDVIAAIASVQRADQVLGTNHSAFVERALRGFVGINATRLGLPPYFADARTGRPLSDAQGCAISYFELTSPELWPQVAKTWYAIYDKHFWQHRITADGYREFANGTAHADWRMDVDSGPVIAGHGVSASAFGAGAARKNGRFDRAYPLAAEMLATVWELPNGVLAVPRLLSNATDAPMLGEAAILWVLTVQPEKGFPVKTGGGVTPYVYIILVGALAFGCFLVAEAVLRFQIARRDPEPEIPKPGFQITLWFGLMVGAGVMLWIASWPGGLILLLLALMLPIKKKTAK